MSLSSRKLLPLEGISNLILPFLGGKHLPNNFPDLIPALRCRRRKPRQRGDGGGINTWGMLVKTPGDWQTWLKDVKCLGSPQKIDHESMLINVNHHVCH